MKKTVFEGAGVAIVTPFTDRTGVRGIDFEKLGELIEMQLANKTDAIIICGSTGESSTMTDDEHREAIKFTVKQVANRVPVIAGAGSNDTLYAAEMTRHACEVGADAILSVTPYYNKATQKGLYEHFKTIANSVDIPIILYNVPSRTNLNINVSTLAELAEIDNIVAVKECNFGQVAETLHRIRNGFSVYSGEDGLVVPCMSLGGKGVISVMSNIIPEDTHNMAKAFLSGDAVTARDIQLGVMDLVAALFCEVNPIPVKAAMNMLGMDVGNCRMPLTDISPEGAEKLRKALTAYGLLK